MTSPSSLPSTIPLSRPAVAAAAAALVSLGPVASSQDGLVGADYPAAKYATQEGGNRVDVSDVDGDGELDVLSAGVVSSSTGISLLFGRGDGTFDPVAELPLGVRPQDAVAIDLDGDGDGDVVAISSDSDLVAVFENLGARTFSSPVTLATVDRPRDVAVVDADADGVLDVLVGSQGTGEIIVFLGDGAGGLTPTTPLTPNRAPEHLEIGDADGDGRDDLLVADFIGDEFDLFPGSAGGFAAPELVPVGPTVRNPVLRDGTGDGVLDLAFIEWNAEGVFLMPGIGDGTFAAPIRTEVGERPSSIEVADLDGDGAPEFLVTRESTFGQIGGRLVVIAGDPVTYFGTNGPALRTGSNPRSTVVHDFDHDGFLDVAAVNNIGGDIALLRGVGDGTVEVPTRIPVAGVPESVLAGDFTGDGLEDLVTCDGGSGLLRLFEGDGVGGFSPTTTSPTQVSCFVARSGDVDGDGDLDVFVQGRRSFQGELAVALNDGTGAFTVSARLPHDQETARALELGDLDDDGRLDIVTTGFFGRLVTWIGQGDGTFLAGPNGTGTESARYMALADVNSDGFLDVVATDTADRRIDTYLGDGTGLLALTSGVATNMLGSSLIRLGDVTGDGVPDAVLQMILSFPDVTGVGVFVGAGDGTFTAGPTRPLRSDASELMLLDVDLDDDPDIVAVLPTAVSDIEIVEVEAGGVLGESVLYSGALEAGALDSGDFDEDGNPDLALASPNAGEVTVLLNRAEVRLDSYCTPFLNSSGARARLTAEGSRSLSQNDLRLLGSDMPPGENVIWFAGGMPGSRVMQGANLCVAGPLQRISMPRTIDPGGRASLAMAFAPLQLTPGTTWYFQGWFSDPMGAAPQFNFTEGLAVLLRP